MWNLATSRWWHHSLAGWTPLNHEISSHFTNFAQISIKTQVSFSWTCNKYFSPPTSINVTRWSRSISWNLIFWQLHCQWQSYMISSYSFYLKVHTISLAPCINVDYIQLSKRRNATARVTPPFRVCDWSVMATPADIIIRGYTNILYPCRPL